MAIIKGILIICCVINSALGIPMEACIGEVVDNNGNGVQTWYYTVEDGGREVAQENWYINYDGWVDADKGDRVGTIFIMDDNGEVDDRRDMAF